MNFTKNIIVFFSIFFFNSNLLAEQIVSKKYLSIRTSIANLRIGPSSAHPIAFVYEKKKYAC